MPRTSKYLTPVFGNINSIMISSDNHTHIILSDIDEMILAARKKRIQRYSITEHVSQFKETRRTIKFGSVHRRGRIFENLKDYLKEFDKVGYPNAQTITIRKGLEVDFSPRYEKKVGDYVNQEKWDFLLCSVHEMEDGTEIEDGMGRPISKEAAHESWRDYMKLQNKALESDFIPFDALTHPVRMSRRTIDVPEELDELLFELAKNARRQGKALELNGSDLEFAPILVRRLASACSKAGCKVSLGSDAHHPFEVSREMPSAQALANEFSLEVI